MYECYDEEFKSEFHVMLSIKIIPGFNTETVKL